MGGKILSVLVPLNDPLTPLSVSQILYAKIGIPILASKMTLPENKIPDKAHEPGCSKPKAIRWYTRTRDKEGKRTLVLGILSCPDCTVSIMVPYRTNLTKKQKEKLIGIPKLPLLINEHDNEIPSDPNEAILWYKKWKLIQITGLRKQHRRTKELYKKRDFFGNEYKRVLEIRRLAKIYKKDEKLYPNLKGRINWDLKLVQEFLDLPPRKWEVQEILNMGPLYRWSIKIADSQRGHIPNPETSDYYIGTKFEPTAPGSEPNEWEKSVIVEAQLRMETMRFLIKLSKQPKIEIQAIA
jgi:hypothetical protein